MKITLLEDRLQFVEWKTGTVHIRDMGIPAFMHRTECGITIPPVGENLPVRVSTSQGVCHRCINASRLCQSWGWLRIEEPVSDARDEGRTTA